MMGDQPAKWDLRYVANSPGKGGGRYSLMRVSGETVKRMKITVSEMYRVRDLMSDVLDDHEERQAKAGI